MHAGQALCRRATFSAPLLIEGFFLHVDKHTWVQVQNFSSKKVQSYLVCAATDSYELVSTRSAVW